MYQRASPSTHPREQLDAVPLHAMQTPALGELLHGDGLARVQSPLVDPALYPIEVDRAHLDLERVVLPAAALRVGDPLRCLTTLKARRYLAVRMLTLLTTSCCLSLAGRGTATTLDALAVGALVVGERGKDGCAALLCGNGEWGYRPL